MDLSARGFLLAGLTTLLGIAGQWSEAAQHLWRLPAGLLVLGLAVEWIRLRAHPPGLHLEAPARAVPGRPLAVTVRLDNPVRKRRRTEAEQALPTALNNLEGGSAAPRLRFDCGPESRCRQAYRLLPTQLGRIAWLPIYSRTRGAFGLAWWSHRTALEGGLDVVPDRLRGGERPPTDPGVGALAGGSPGRGQELLGLRPYQPGDPPRHVDWKASARSGRRMLRLYAQEQHLTLMLLIDAGRTAALQCGPLTRLHHYLNSAARLAELAAAQGDRVGLVVYADRPLVTLAPRGGLPAVRELRRHLAQVRVQERESNPVPAVLAAVRLLHRRSLTVLFGDLENARGSGQLGQAMALLRPKHLPLTVGLRDPELAALTRAPGDHPAAPYTALAAYQLEHAQRGAELAIRRLGGEVARAFPEHLDRTVLSTYRQLRARRRV